MRLLNQKAQSMRLFCLYKIQLNFTSSFIVTVTPSFRMGCFKQDRFKSNLFALKGMHLGFNIPHPKGWGY